MSSLAPNQLYHNRYKLIQLVGTGGYSEVWHASDTKTGGIEVALKIFAPDKGIDLRALKVFSDEFAITFSLSHPNLLKPIYYDECERSPFLVLPYCKQGSVTYRAGEMTESDLARFLQQSASALAYLHNQEPPIIHQDIKPDNFLIDNQGNYLLSDFGISSKIRRTLTRSMGAPASAGTMAYMPPEKFSADKQVIKAGDIFSLGVTLYELLTGDLPFGDNGGLTLKAGADVPNLPAGYSPELNELLKRCMAKEPWERPMAEELQQIAEAYLHSRSWKSPSVQIEESNVFSNDVTTMEDRVPNIKSDEQAGKEKPLPPVRPTQPVPTASDPSAGPKAVPGKRGSREPFPLFFIFLSLFLVIVIAVPNLMAPSAQELAEKARQDSVVQVEAEKVRIAEEDQMIVRNVNYKTFKVNGVTFEMAYIKGGTFLMGSNDGEDNEKPVQRMTVNDFFMGKTEVTQALWNAVMGDNHSNLKGDSLPVNYIIWDEAQKFIRKLSLLTGRTFRLPTEAEWEYAAGGGLFIPTKWAGTNSENELKRFAWYGSNSDSKTHKVATKSPNGVGLYDMTGNVEEWCSDLCGDYSHSRQKRNSQGYSLGSGLVRGGDWGTSLPYWCRISVRKCYPHFPQVQFGNLGLRVVYTPYFNEYLNK